MKTPSHADTQLLEPAFQSTSPQSRGDREEASIRTLQDWELLLAGGGDGAPGWPG